MKAIVAALDLENNTALVAEQAAGMAEKFGAALHLIHVVSLSGGFMTSPGITDPSLGTLDPVMMTDELELLEVQKKVAGESLGKIAASLPVMPVAAKVLVGDVETEVLDYVKEADAGMIVIGTHQYRGLMKLLMHETSVKLLREAKIPVLVIPTDVKKEAK